MAITIKTGKEARAEILSGATQLNQVVSSSLGHCRPMDAVSPRKHGRTQQGRSNT